MWRRTGRRSIALPYPPTAEEFDPLVHTVAYDLAQKIEELRVLPAARDRSKIVPPAGMRKTILLAQPTDDVDDETEQVRRYLMQYSAEVAVLPERPYPQGGEAFAEAFAADLARADLFVQLLGNRIGRIPPDLPGGYTRHQLDSALKAGIPVLQWRQPQLDSASVSQADYRRILMAETVTASGLESFKADLLERARRRNTPSSPSRPDTTTVFIDADENDLPVARQIEDECVRRRLTTILPMTGASSEANRKDLADNLTDCDALFFVYGDTSQDWMRSQLRFFSKVKAQRQQDPRILAICSGPPDKPPIGITVPNAKLVECAPNWNLEPIRTLISELSG
jgi:hypothetical protein